MTVPDLDKSCSLYSEVLLIRFTDQKYAYEAYIRDPSQEIQSASVSGPYGSSELTYNLYSNKPGMWWTDPNIEVWFNNPPGPTTWTFTIKFKNDSTCTEIKETTTWEWAE